MHVNAKVSNARPFSGAQTHRIVRVTSSAAASCSYAVGSRTSHRFSKASPMQQEATHFVSSIKTLRTGCLGRVRIAIASSDEGGIKSTEGGRTILVLGGTGRVGSSTAATLLKLYPSDTVVVAGRSKASYDAAVERRPVLKGAKFEKCDLYDAQSLQHLVGASHLVVHTAGPFQRATGCPVLEAALATKTPYLDVCDDSEYSRRVKSYHDAAVSAGVPAITTGGIYPGTSNIMAAHMISIARKEYNQDYSYRQPAAAEGVQPSRLLYSYYTAGSGGAGPTILQTSFLLAGEEVEVWKNGKEYKLPPVSNRRVVDFGPGVGRKGVYLYNLPEIYSAHHTLNVPSVSARFGTDPFIWNWAMWLTARLTPKHLLEDRNFVKSFASLSDPWVRAVDKIVGETVAMKIEVEYDNGTAAGGLFVHKLLSDAMGWSVAGFADAMLQGGTAPGVWYPEEKEALKDRIRFLKLASTGCRRFELNQPLWALEEEPKQLGMGFYV